MNKPFTRPAAYEQDLQGWALRQAGLLRAGRTAELDTANLAAEIEGVAAAEYHRLVSALRVLLVHMLKWDHQPARRSRSWTLTIREQRDRVERFLRRIPSQKASLDEAVADAYREAVLGTARETELPLAVFPATCRYDWSTLTERPHLWDE